MCEVEKREGGGGVGGGGEGDGGEGDGVGGGGGVTNMGDHSRYSSEGLLLF